MSFLSHPQPEKTQQLVFPSSQARNPGLWCYIQNESICKQTLGGKTETDCPPELACKTLYWRKQRNQAVTALEHLPCSLAFTVPEGSMQAAGGEKPSVIESGFGPLVLWCQVVSQDRTVSAIVAWLFWGQLIASCFLIGSEDCSTRGN